MTIGRRRTDEIGDIDVLGRTTIRASPWTATALEGDHAHELTRGRVRVVTVWREALAVFSERAPSILSCGLLGWSGAMVLCAALSAAFGLPDYLHASGLLVTTEGLLAVFSRRSGFGLLAFQAAVALLASTFAKGVITGIALIDANDSRLSLRASCLITLRRFPALLLGALISGSLIACGVVGVNVLLRPANLDLSRSGQVYHNPGGAAHMIGLRSLDAMIPDPGSPFTEYIPYFRLVAFRDLSQSPAGELTGMGQVVQSGVAALVTAGASDDHASHSLRFWLVGLGAVVLIVLAATLLRFYAVMALIPRKPAYSLRGFGLLMPLIESVRFGFRHFSLITLHVWVLRLTIVAVSMIVVIVPVALSQSYAVPGVIRLIKAPWIHPASVLLLSMSLAMANAILAAFGAVYDARLYAMIEKKKGPAAFETL